MKPINALWLIPPIICLVICFYMIINDKPGWGWLLFVAYGVSYSSKHESDNKIEP